MEFYSRSKPNLIAPKLKKTIYKIMKDNSKNKTISEKISNLLYEFYKSYIYENKVLILIIFLIIIFLMYRYYNRKEKFANDDDYDVLKDIMGPQTSHLRYDTQPYFNNLKSVEDQQQSVNYPPDPLPVNIPDKGIVYTRNLYDDPDPYPKINTANYDYDNVYKNKSLSYYNGTHNTYNNAQDTNIINPLGYLNNFNTSTGDFVGQMTDENTKNILDYQSILDNNQSALIDSLKVGPVYLDTENYDLEMEPPYATE